MLMKSRNLEISTLTTCVYCVCRSKSETMHACFEQSIRKASNKQKRKTKKRAGGTHAHAYMSLRYARCVLFACAWILPVQIPLEWERERRTPWIHIITIGCYRSTSVLLVKTAAANCIATASSSYAPAGRYIEREREVVELVSGR